MNKSLLTNLISLAIVVVGYALPATHSMAPALRAIGLFAVSGAFTNWIAIHMLFEKVPGFYGSGVIPSRFKEFKEAIRDMIMNQFFTAENVQSFFASQEGEAVQLNPEPIIALVDYDHMFGKLTDTVMASPMGGMLGMFGGSKALEPLKAPFQKNMEQEIRSLVESPKLVDAIRESMASEGADSDNIIAKVEQIVTRRLDELTPQMVKTIVQEMIRQHLGWLVVWGGVFGGLIGLITTLLPT